MARQKHSRPVGAAYPDQPDSSGGAGFSSAAAPAAPRDRSWEKAHPTASYRIPEAVRDQVLRLAQEHGVTASEMAGYLLRHALRAVERGELVIRPRLKTGKFTLEEK